MKSIERRVAALETAAVRSGARRPRIEIMRFIVSARDGTRVGVVLPDHNPATLVRSTRTLRGAEFDEWCERNGHVLQPR